MKSAVPGSQPHAHIGAQCSGPPLGQRCEVEIPGSIIWSDFPCLAASTFIGTLCRSLYWQVFVFVLNLISNICLVFKQFMSPALTGGFFTTPVTWESPTVYFR